MKLRESVILGAAMMSWLCGAGSGQETVVRDGTLTGTITFRGEIPKSPVPDDAGIARNLLVVDPKTWGLANVVVWLEPVKTNAMFEAAGTLKAATMDQRDHEFVPRVLAVRAGQPVKFTNSDPANHNVRTSSAVRTNEFNVYTGADGSYTHRFAADQPGRPIRLGCDIHPWMRGWIYVFEHPYFAVTDERGQFRIEGVPPAEYEVVIKQPDINYSARRKARLTGAKTNEMNLEVSVRKNAGK